MGNAMRYILTGDHWSAEEAFRMGEVQEVVQTPEKALETGIALVRIFSGRSSNRSSSFAEASNDRSVKIAGVRIYLNVDQGWALSLKCALECLIDIA